MTFFYSIADDGDIIKLTHQYSLNHSQNRKWGEPQICSKFVSRHHTRQGASKCDKNVKTDIVRTPFPLTTDAPSERKTVKGLIIHSNVIFTGCISPCPESSFLSNPYAYPSTGVQLLSRFHGFPLCPASGSWSRCRKDGYFPKGRQRTDVPYWTPSWQ